MKLTITDVRALPGDSAFLVDDGQTAILYDTGFAFTGYRVAENVQKVLGDRPLDYIFLTHSHYDHASGAAYVARKYPNVKVVAGEYAAKIFAKPTARDRMREMDRKFADRCSVGEYEDLFDELRVDIPVRDGDTVQAGSMTFTAVDLPGHTKCSVGYFLKEEKLLLSTETLGVYDGGRMVVPSYLVGYRMTLDSIAKAESLGVEQILLPHFGLLDRDRTAFYLGQCRKNAVLAAEGIAEVLQKGGSFEDAARYFREAFYRENVPEIYPEDAMELNTGITVRLIAREVLGRE